MDRARSFREVREALYLQYLQGMRRIESEMAVLRKAELQQVTKWETFAASCSAPQNTSTERITRLGLIIPDGFAVPQSALTEKKVNVGCPLCRREIVQPETTTIPSVIKLIEGAHSYNTLFL